MVRLFVLDNSIESGPATDGYNKRCIHAQEIPTRMEEATQVKQWKKRKTDSESDAKAFLEAVNRSVNPDQSHESTLSLKLKH